MGTLTRLLSWRYLRKHAWRMVLATVSICLGVATLVGARVLNHSTLAAVSSNAQKLAGQADLQISNDALGGVELRWLEVVRQTPGVAAATPLLSRRVRVRLPSGEERSTLLLGIDPDGDPRVRPQQQAASRMPPGGRLPILGTPVAASGPGLVLQPPCQLQLLTPSGWKPTYVAATLREEGLGGVMSGNLLVMHVEPALAFFQTGAGTSPRVTRFDLVLETGMDRHEVVHRLERLLEGQALVHAPKTRDSGLEDLLVGIQMGLSVGALVALIVGMFLVYNTLAVTVAERRHDIGILRALGATQGQVRFLFAMEAVILGVIGSLAGVGVGLLLARFSLGTISRVLQQQFAAIDVRELAWTPAMLAQGMAAGLIASVLAALVPAAQAAAEPPSDAIRRAPLRRTGWHYWRSALIAALLLAVGTAALAGREWFPPRTASYASAVLLLVAFMLTTPLLVRAGLALLRPITRCLGTAGRLAADDLERSPGRTGLTVGALALGLAMTIETHGTIVSTEEPVFDWLTRAVRADLFVTSGTAITGGGEHTLMDGAIEADLAAIPGVADVLPVRLLHVDYGPYKVLLVSLPLEAYRRHVQSRISSGPTDLVPALMDPERRGVIISDNFARQHGKRVGDELELLPGQPPWRVVATAPDYSWNRGSVFMDRGCYRHWFGDPLVDTFDVYVAPGTDRDEVRRTIQERLGADHELVILTNRELQEHIRGMMRQFYVLLYANGYLAILVALLGVTNTLAIAVLLRKRELGLLRAVGASRGQVAASIAAQALLVGTLGLLLGTGLGAVLQELVLRVFMVEETGYDFAFLFPWRDYLGTAILALAAAQIAGLGPALRAAYLPVSEAVAYE